MFPEPGQGRYRWRGGAKPKDFADGCRGCRMPAERRCVEIGQAARFEPELLAAPALGPLPGARTGKVGVLQRACLGWPGRIRCEPLELWGGGQSVTGTTSRSMM